MNDPKTLQDIGKVDIGHDTEDTLRNDQTTVTMADAADMTKPLQKDETMERES